MLRCTELGLVDDSVLDSFSVGMVYDMLTEKANDRENYPIKGTADDVRAFFGG